MCGIAGFIDYRKRFAGEEMRDLARAMACEVEHRGPDDSGEWIDAEAGIALGHRRLSIIDLSPLGSQPMVSHSGRFVIAYNGEVYNFPALRRELEADGIPFKGNSDTEVILAAFELWGVEKAVTRFNGMFAFALWDRRERELHLVRDRLGIKPLYYGRIDGSMLFASELKAMRRHPSFKPEIDRDVLALFFRFNYIPEPWSIYKGIRKLPPGTLVTFRVDGGEEGPRPYWSAAEAVERGLADPFNGSEDEALEELEALLRDSVKMRMISDVPLGALLSGGIDSSLVSSLMQAEASGRIKTFTIGFESADYNEAEDARAVAAHLGTDHTELYVSPGDALAVIPEMPKIYDEPFSDSSQIPTCLVSRLVRKHVTVCLSGDGGDELFGGYNRHVWLERIRKGVGRLPRALRAALALGIKALPPRSWDAVYRTAGRILPGDHRQRTPGEKLHKLAGILPVRGADAMYYAALSVFVTQKELHPGIREFPHKMMFLDLIGYLPGDILTKVDRASMAVSLELRVPYLDHRVVEFAWRLPLDFKIKNGVGKRPLRRLLHRHVPRELVDRPKAGFGAPIVDWLRGPLREWAEELLDEGRLRREGFIEPGPVRKKWRQHLSGRRNWQYHLWDVLMFQAWYEAQR
jgi:asparagine synthase (glutamine-hydrolysing)